MNLSSEPEIWMVNLNLSVLQLICILSFMNWRKFPNSTAMCSTHLVSLHYHPTIFILHAKWVGVTSSIWECHAFYWFMIQTQSPRGRILNDSLVVICLPISFIVTQTNYMFCILWLAQTTAWNMSALIIHRPEEAWLSNTTSRDIGWKENLCTASRIAIPISW